MLICLSCKCTSFSNRKNRPCRCNKHECAFRVEGSLEIVLKYRLQCVASWEIVLSSIPNRWRIFSNKVTCYLKKVRCQIPSIVFWTLFRNYFGTQIQSSTGRPLPSSNTSFPALKTVPENVPQNFELGLCRRQFCVCSATYYRHYYAPVRNLAKIFRSNICPFFPQPVRVRVCL